MDYFRVSVILEELRKVRRCAPCFTAWPRTPTSKVCRRCGSQHRPKHFYEVGHVASRHPQSMKMRSRSVYDPAQPVRDEGRFPLAHKARYKVWPGHRSEPQIVASLRRKHAEQIVSPFDVFRRREEGDE